MGLGVLIGLGVVIGIPLLIALWAIGVYNGLVLARNQVKNAWAQIDVQLKRRHDLIPNLVETAKGYMQHERGTLENITKARNLAAQPHGVADQSKAEAELTRAMSSFFVVVENYPDLKSNVNVSQLQEELATTENQIAFSRQHYNASVLTYNTQIATIPNVFIAGPMGFTKREFFEAEPEAQVAPEVSLR